VYRGTIDLLQDAHLKWAGFNEGNGLVIMDR
jgi:hypothetical protein